MSKLLRDVSFSQKRIVLRNVIMILCGCLALASCDLFSTRTPETPDLGTTFIWTPAATPSTLFDNFTGTIAAVDASNYARCFISIQDTVTTGAAPATYSFIPRAGLDQSSRSIFDTWTVQSEQNFLTKLRASLVSNPKVTITITNKSIDQSNATTARISADYLILLPLPSNSTLPGSIAGSLIFQLVLVTTPEGTKEWRIASWTDFASATGTKSISDLKIQLAS